MHAMHDRTCGARLAAAAPPAAARPPGRAGARTPAEILGDVRAPSPVPPRHGPRVVVIALRRPARPPPPLLGSRSARAQFNTVRQSPAHTAPRAWTGSNRDARMATNHQGIQCLLRKQIRYTASRTVGSTGRPFEELESVSVGSLVFPESEMLLLKQASTATFGFEPHIQM